MAYTTKDLEKQKAAGHIKRQTVIRRGAGRKCGGARRWNGKAGNKRREAGRIRYRHDKTLLNKPKDYEESDEVKQAQEDLKNHYNSKPGDYQSNYADQIQGF